MLVFLSLSFRTTWHSLHMFQYHLSPLVNLQFSLIDDLLPRHICVKTNLTRPAIKITPHRNDSQNTCAYSNNFNFLFSVHHGREQVVESSHHSRQKAESSSTRKEQQLYFSFEIPCTQNIYIYITKTKVS